MKSKSILAASLFAFVAAPSLNVSAAPDAPPTPRSKKLLPR